MTVERAHLAVDQTGKEVIVPELALKLYDPLGFVPGTTKKEHNQAAFDMYCRLRRLGLTAGMLTAIVLHRSRSLPP